MACDQLFRRLRTHHRLKTPPGLAVPSPNCFAPVSDKASRERVCARHGCAEKAPSNQLVVSAADVLCNYRLTNSHIYKPFLSPAPEPMSFGQRAVSSKQ